MRIVLLAVDDESGILRLLHIELSAQGFRVLTASNGKEAVRMAEQHRPDIALLDILMPGASGLELMKEFRERWNMPIILLTARDRDEPQVEVTTARAHPIGRVDDAAIIRGEERCE